MKSVWIQAELKDRGITQKQIAKNLKKSGAAVANVINRKMTSQDIAEYIAEAIDLPLSCVFPEYPETN